MDASQIDTSKYTTVHFAFATVDSSFSVVIDDKSKAQFDAFRQLGSSVKKVIFFGGWAFSTEVSSFQLFRDATKPANRATFAKNAVDFLKSAGCDGLDFDWEYPGAPDIPGIPLGTAEDALNHMKFLSLVKGQLPSGATLSIALPASYWYLKQYPVKQMQNVVDYFVYMTYDFHGQWDYDNKFSAPGCPSGNCIRSHVNISETTTALSMITKAGVNANKLDWVSYMDATTKDSRNAWIPKLNMGDSTDWAVDLETFQPAPGGGGGGDNPDPDDKCEENRTYKAEAMPDGEYMDYFLMDPENAATTGRQYVTIVNLTPHRFVLDHTHSYQMDTEAVKANPVDDNGEAYYNIQGTDKKFVIRATTHIPDNKVPVTLVITGSADYKDGFIASISHGPGGWMRRIYDTIKDRPIHSIVMPGTHDSGMSRQTHQITEGLTSEANLITQGINIYDQARPGARAGSTCGSRPSTTW
ncbi:glycoside hydrolase superfamily [Diplogelasinospora grovesii]|uniref:chitinase n=1 Tax=Diplogelasinospora grovesii TaxID=303347 RepID=A0AAN6NB08_9PEZI|nr:glycoside hydrolase superfamily [Diplogelasinospora grovesii]